MNSIAGEHLRLGSGMDSLAVVAAICASISYLIVGRGVARRLALPFRYLIAVGWFGAFIVLGGYSLGYGVDDRYGWFAVGWVMGGAVLATVELVFCKVSRCAEGETHSPDDGP